MTEPGDLLFEQDVKQLLSANDLPPEKAEDILDEWSSGYYGYRPGWHARRSALADLQKIIMRHKYGIPQANVDASEYAMPELEDVLEHFQHEFQEETS